MSRRRRITAVVSAVVLAAAAAAALITASCGSAAADDTTAAPTLQSPPPQPPGADAMTSGGAAANGSSSTETATYTCRRTVTKTGRTWVTRAKDRSVVRVQKGGNLTLRRCVMKKTGGTSSLDNSSFYGLNAAVLVKTGGKAKLVRCTVKANASGANGVFATGSGARITMSGGKVICAGQGAHGLDATLGGAISASNVTIRTSGANAAALATDRGSGTITVNGGTMTTTGADSPGIYSTGVFTITGATITSSGSEAAVIEGSNSITLTNTSLTTSLADKWGVMIYQSMSGDAEGAEGTFTMTGGKLADTAGSGPLFYVTNSTGVITLKGVDVTAGSGTLVSAAAGRWGTSGANGGTVILTGDGQTLTGNLAADSLSSITANLTNSSSLTGAVDTANSGKAVTLTLDASSTWTVTADSYLTALSDPSGISGTTVTNITGNGHTVWYDTSTCPALGGLTYTLSGGGYLKPAS